jgi:histidine ammonia-lyase
VNAAKALPQDEIEQLAFGEKEGLSMQACVCGVR